MTTRHLPRLIAFLLTGIYVLLIAWFDFVDFYRLGFFEHGTKVVQYHLARLLFIPFLMWIVYAVGAGVIALVSGRRALETLTSWDRYPLGFIAGAGIWHALLLGCGLAGLYTKSLAVFLTVGVMLFSIPHMATCLQQLANKLKSFKYSSTPVALKGLLFFACIACSAAAIAFLLIKGIYPNGGSDYIGHYFYFYKRVVETGSILPNDVWYHFYYSKGLGLYFLSMLLTDALAPQLVASGFIAVGALIVFAMLRKGGRHNFLGLAGVFLYILLQIYTPGPAENAAHGGWGDLEKTHEITAVLLLAVIWISSHLSAANPHVRGPWIVALVSAILCISIITLPLALLAGLYMSGYLIWYVARRAWGQAIWPLIGGVSAAVGIASIALINYKYTGLPSDQGMLLSWSFADMQALQDWGVWLEVLWTHWYYTSYQLQSAPWDWKLLPLLWKFLRLEIWWPIAAAALPVLAWRLFIPAERKAIDWPDQRSVCWALVWFAAIVVVSALLGGGRSQYISFYRLSSFSYAPTLCLVLLLWNWAFLSPSPDTRKVFRRAMIGAGIILPFLIAVFNIPAPQRESIGTNLRSITTDAWRFATGKYSIKDAFQHQKGRPGRTLWGGIYEGIVPAWKIAGPNTRIWTFHPASVCMLPDCNLQGFPAMRLTRQWDVVFFGSPNDAVRVLKSEGLNFFFFSKELGVADILPAAKLFSPENIAQNLAVRWTDGTSYLLSWPGPDTKPIDDTFLAAYKDATSTSGLYKPFKDKIQEWEAISLYLSKHKTDLQPFDLPWCRTCDNVLPVDYKALLKATQ